MLTNNLFLAVLIVQSMKYNYRVIKGDYIHHVLSKKFNFPFSVLSFEEWLRQLPAGVFTPYPTILAVVHYPWWTQVVTFTQPPATPVSPMRRRRTI